MGTCQYQCQSLTASHMIHANAQSLGCDIKRSQIHKLYLSCFLGILKELVGRYYDE